MPGSIERGKLSTLSNQINLDDLEAFLAAKLQAVPEVAGAYLFGSILDDFRPASDIDIALIVDRATQQDFRRTLEIEALCQLRLTEWEGHPFDVTALDPQNWFFSFRAVQTGRLAYAADKDRVTDFIEQVARLHADLYPRYRKALDEVLEA